MKLSLEILKEALLEEFEIDQHFASERLELKKAVLLTGAPLEPDTVYMVEARRLPVRWKRTERDSLVVCGQVPEGYFEGSPVSWISVRDNRFPLVCNAVLTAFARYQDFEMNLKSAVLEAEEPERLCERIGRFLGSPIIVFDDRLRLVYCSSEAESLLEWERDDYSDYRTLPTEFINQLNLVYMESGEHFRNGAVLLRDDRLSYNLITTLNGRDEYILMVFETEKPLTIATQQVASQCVGYILRAFEQARGNNPAYNGLETLVKFLLGGSRYNATDLEIRLETVGWKSSDNCCCMVIFDPYSRVGAKSLSAFCLKVEKSFKACVAFLYEDKAVAVVNLDKSGCKPRDIPNRIGILIREGLLKAGVSFRYWSFENTRIYYQQACSAYEMGTLYDPDKWCYMFEDVALRYFMHYGASRIPPRHLCHPVLVELFRYDEANGTDLLHTMEAYVNNNCNAVTAANQLFIHRNTFYQRMSKIQELMDVNLADQEVRLYLQLSSYLIAMYYYEKDNGLKFPAE